MTKWQKKLRRAAPTPKAPRRNYVRVQVDLGVLRKAVAEKYRTLTVFADDAGLDKTHASCILRGKRNITTMVFDKLRKVFPDLQGERIYG